jgi:trigger factor
MEQNKGNKMQVSVEEKEGLERVLTITIEALIFDEQFDARVRKLCKTERVNGFRTGKIPVSVIEKRFGPKIEHDVCSIAQ